MKFRKILPVCLLAAIITTGCASGKNNTEQAAVSVKTGVESPAAESNSPAPETGEKEGAAAQSGKEEAKPAADSTSFETIDPENGGGDNDVLEKNDADAPDDEEDEIGEERIEGDNNPDLGDLDDEPDESSSSDIELTADDMSAFEEGGARAE